MTRTSLADVQSVADPAQTWNFDLFLPSIPGSSNTRNLTFKCMTTGLPGFSLDKVPVPLHGVEIQYAGRKVYSHQFNSQFMEASDWSTRDQFYNWSESARSWINNSGTMAAQYKVNGQIAVYNDLPQVSRTIKVLGMWPEVVGDVELDGSQSGLVTLQITWSFDLVIDM